MKRKIIHPATIVILALFAIVQLFYIVKLYSKNSDLLSKIGNLESKIQSNIEINTLRDKENEKVEIRQPSIQYIEYEYNKRLVVDELNIKALPEENSVFLNTIMPFSVIEVEDAAIVGDGSEIWLYVSIPVYDTPINYKGWVPESKTTLLTKENVSSVKGDVYILKGTVTLTGQVIDMDQRGRIVETDEKGNVTISLPGGASILVKKSDIKYPDNK